MSLLSRTLAFSPKRIFGFQSRLIHRSTFRTKEFKVVLDNDILYVDQALAEALGWDASQTKGVALTLSGWAPNYFAIARSGSDSDLLARGTVESSRNPKVQEILEYLKDR